MDDLLLRRRMMAGGKRKVTIWWNQIFQTGRSNNLAPWDGIFATASVGTKGAATVYMTVSTTPYGATWDTTHQYLLYIGYTTGTISDGKINLYAYNWQNQINASLTVQNGSSPNIVKAICRPNATSSYFILSSVANTVVTSEVKMFINIFDLTEMFGAGNEPTVAEFESIFPEDYYPYNAGEEIEIEI